MKNQKKLIGLAAVLVCLVLFLVLVLTRCSDDHADSVEQLESSEQITEETEQTSETTEQTTEETTEESTGETEEETTEPEDTPDDDPGGNGGFIGGVILDEEDEEEEPSEDPTEETVPVENPGSESNPYAEYVLQLPDDISSVAVPAGQTISYLLYDAAGSVLTVADADAYILYNGATYEANSGVVTLDLTAVEESPVSIQIGNRSGNEAGYVLHFDLPLGAETNPEILDTIDQIDLSVSGAYYCRWTAPGKGVLTLTLEDVTPAEAVVEITLSNGKTVSVLTEGTVSIDADEGDVITILVKTSESAQVSIAGVYTLTQGTAGNPYEVTLETVPGSFTTAEIPAGEQVYYQVYNASGLELTVETADAYVIYSGVTYRPQDGVITLRTGTEDPVCLIFGTGRETAALTVAYDYPLGAQQNPRILEDVGEWIVSVSQGSYYLLWTAPDAGTLTVTGAGAGAFSVTLTNGETLAEMTDGAACADVLSGDVVTIRVTAETETEVTLNLSFLTVPGTESNPYEITVEEIPGTVEIAAEESGYYRVYQVGGTEMTVTGEGSVIYNGISCTAGSVHVENATDCEYVLLQITGPCTLTFSHPVGSQENPLQITDVSELNPSLSGGESYFYRYTAVEDGAVSFWVDEELSTENAVYNIILTCTHYDSETEAFTSVSADLSRNEYPTVSLQAAKGDVLTIQVSASTAANLAVRGTVFTGQGTSEKPYTADVHEIPGAMAAVDILNGSELTFCLKGVGETLLTVEGTDAYVRYNGHVYEAENGVVTVETACEATTIITIGNHLTSEEITLEAEEAAEGYMIRFARPVGAEENPEMITDPAAVEIRLAQGDETGYYLSWTAQEAGDYLFRVDCNTDGVSAAIELIADAAITENGDGTVRISVEAGTVVTIHVTVLADENGSYPEAALVVSGTRIIEETPEETEPEETEPEETEPEETEPEETEPEETEPEETEPEETEPEETEPEETEPEETEPEETEPEETEPEETEPEETEPEETEPEETEPEETEPEETEPEETEPEETEPEETEPEETEPEETEPEETEPEETEPEETESEETEPEETEDPTEPAEPEETEPTE